MDENLGGILGRSPVFEIMVEEQQSLLDWNNAGSERNNILSERTNTVVESINFASYGGYGQQFQIIGVTSRSQNQTAEDKCSDRYMETSLSQSATKFSHGAEPILLYRIQTIRQGYRKEQASSRYQQSHNESQANARTWLDTLH